jgi:hypothetical protein
VPQFADGGSWKTRIVLAGKSLSLPAKYTLNFFGQNGQPLAFSLMGHGLVSTLSGTVPPGGSAIIETLGAQANLQAGWIEVLSGDPGDSQAVPPKPPSSQVTAFVTFRQRIQGRPDYEAGVYSQPGDSRSVGFAMDNLESYVTSIAVANTIPTPAAVTVRFRDSGGAVFHQEVVNLAGRGHAFFETTNRFLPSRDRRGTVEFTTTTGALAALCLWFNPTGPFTSIPELTLVQ